MSAERVVYSIQRTYILTHVLTPEREIVTCDQRIDIPTIEPLTQMKAVVYQEQPGTVVPCIELAGTFLSEFDLTFETNEGVTVLPVKIQPGSENSLENPYTHFRYVLVLPRDATGVKSCKLIHKATGKEVQHNFTFGIMPPPYNYDNALLGYISYAVKDNRHLIEMIASAFETLAVSNNSRGFASASLNKGEGAQTVRILPENLFFYTDFWYPLTPEPTIHKPIIAVITDSDEFDFTLSLNKTKNTVLIDLFTGRITAYDSDNGEIIQQFMFNTYNNAFKTLVFDNFDDIDDSTLTVTPRGARLNV